MKLPCFLKVYQILSVCFLLFALTLQAQEFNFDDPNYIYKDKNGNVISLDSAKALINRGPVSLMQSLLGDGKIAIKIIPMSGEDIIEFNNEKNEWVEKWINQKFPDFSLKNLKGETISNSNLKNKIAVINFWFIGCKPCVQEMPELNKLVKKYESEGVVFLAPSIDDISSLNNFSKKKAFNYTILGESRILNNKLGVYAYPTHMILDKDGIIRNVLIGGDADFNKLDEFIGKILESYPE